MGVSHNQQFFLLSGQSVCYKAGKFKRSRAEAEYTEDKQREEHSPYLPYTITPDKKGKDCKRKSDHDTGVSGIRCRNGKEQGIDPDDEQVVEDIAPKPKVITSMLLIGIGLGLALSLLMRFFQGPWYFPLLIVAACLVTAVVYLAWLDRQDFRDQ